MGRINAVLLAVLVAWAPALAAQDLAEQQALARQIERRFDVLPAQGGVMLRPKTPMRDVRSIQLVDGAIAIDGEPVSGAELRQRLESDADSIIRLSYLDAAAQRALFAPAAAPRPAPAAGDPAPPRRLHPRLRRPRRLPRRQLRPRHRSRTHAREADATMGIACGSAAASRSVRTRS